SRTGRLLLQPRHESGNPLPAGIHRPLRRRLPLRRFRPQVLHFERGTEGTRAVRYRHQPSGVQPDSPLRPLKGTLVYQIQVLTLTVGTVLPILVGLVTKASWGGGWRAVILAALSALGGVGSSALDAANAGVYWDWKMAAITAFNTWLIAVASHFGLWKPTGVSAAAKARLVKDKVDLAA